MPMPPTAAPAQAAGRNRARWAGLPFLSRLLTNSIECARYDRQKAGSTALSSSCTIAAAVASMPDPPYSGSAVIPRRPSSPSCRNKARLNFSSLLYSNACGSTWFSANERTISLSWRCSSVGLNKSILVPYSLLVGASKCWAVLLSNRVFCEVLHSLSWHHLLCSSGAVYFGGILGVLSLRNAVIIAPCSSFDDYFPLTRSIL
mmetsp:Transcript_41141/g.67429  ORF Transcript_41141/g.67429 Transcript_41141/m.67429 type:complete len:203 (-) Transcript_41141:221-829(-)